MNDSHEQDSMILPPLGSFACDLLRMDCPPGMYDFREMKIPLKYPVDAVSWYCTLQLDRA